MMTLDRRALVLFVERRGQYTDAAARLQEDVALAENAGLDVVDKDICVLRRHPSAASFIGKGWVEKVRQKVADGELAYVVIDPEISPIQQRTLEKAWGCKVLTRTAVILEIFAQRARTAAGTLQVQLAKLLYQKGRLVGSWTHLERQRGGFGFLGGPGESQLELDKRMLRDQIAHIEKKLERVVKTRDLHRKARQKIPYPVVALVGYTNAGKSTLFNRLSGASVGVEDRPFETLDPTMRKVTLPSGRSVIFSDTVGFISGLPKSLRMAFEVTLDEVKEADLLLHVRDSASPQTEAQKKDVLDVLSAMHCTTPLIEVLNKIDLRPGYSASPDVVAVSALKDGAFKVLLQKIDTFLDQQTLCLRIKDPYVNGALLPFLYEHGHVLDVCEDRVLVRMSKEVQGRFTDRFPEASYELCEA